MIESNSDSRLIAFPTKIGWMGIMHSGHKIQYIKICLANRDSVLPEFAKFEIGPESKLDATEKSWRELFQSYAKGQTVKFKNLRIETENMTVFQQKVVTGCRKIPHGKTLSYLQLANKAGSPKAARAVGTVMRKNNFPIVVPCHRVVASNGIGGYSASDGVSTKRRLLKLEGAQI